MKNIKLKKINIGNDLPFILIAGPCVIESEKHCLYMAKELKNISQSLKIPFIFKVSFDKANRSSINSYRGKGFKEGVRILNKIKKEIQVPIITDVHSIEQVDAISKVADIIQIPAFLCRQTDLLIKIAETNKIINVKKGQFLAPWDIKNIYEKIKSTGNNKIIFTERGVSFGYNNLISDMRSLVIMKKTEYPIIFDATHSVQLPGGLGDVSGGQREFVEPLSLAAISIGIAGIFLEVHDNPEKALCDGPNMIKLNDLKKLLKKIKKVDLLIKNLN